MGDRKRVDTRTSTGLRIPTELYDKLKEAAEDRDLSVNYLITKAVEDFLPRLIPADDLKLTRDP